MSKKYEFDYDLIVIGSGAGGSAAAGIVASSGKRVAIIEADSFGGESPNWSDVPIKALLHAANLYDEARHGARFGLRSNTLGYNYPSIRAWKDLAVKRTGASNNRQYYEEQNVAAYSGKARFITPNEITVNRRHLSAHKFLIATGSHGIIPDVKGLEKVGYLTPRTFLETVRPPKSMLIVGGGEVGVEIAQLLAIFGTKVYIAEQEERLLPNFDKEVDQVLEHVFTNRKGMTVLKNSKVVAVEKEGLGKKVIISRAGVEKSIKVDEILIAAGRKPNVDLGLENAGVKFNEDGIEVNNYLQTNIKHIYAAGDVLGLENSTYNSLLQSRIVANNILHNAKLSPDYAATPSIVFTSPDIASVGFTEDYCVKNKISYKKSLAPINIIARSNTSDFRDGFVKILADKRGIIIGATIAAPHAGEIIHELALAVKYEMTALQVAETPHAFLSWSEAVKVAASKLA